MNERVDELKSYLDKLVETVVKAVVAANNTQEMDCILSIRDELQRLPDGLVTEVLNDVMLKLVEIDPALCRWFILDVYLLEADPEGKADVAERINLLMADLRSH